MNDQTFQTYAPSNPPGFSQTVQDRYSVNGGNLLGRLSHAFTAESELNLQLYYDRTERHTAIVRQDQDTYDLDLQHRFAMGSWNGVVWGLGYRATSEKVVNSQTVMITPPDRTIQLFSAFIQDEITIVPERLHLTLGSKFEHNDFTGFEIQPGTRLSWTPDKRQTFWGAVSRAVRTPSIAESGVTLNSVTTLPPNALFPGSPATPVVTPFFGNSGFKSEELLAYELGYRAEPVKDVSLDLAIFYNEYDRLRSQDRGAPNFFVAPPVIPTTVGNNLRGSTYGLELGPVWRVCDWWTLRPSYSLLKMRLRVEPGSTDTTSTGQVGQSPQQQFGLRSSMDFPQGLSLNCMLRYVDRLPAFGIPAYTELGVSLIWRATDNLEFAVVGQNLLHRNHAEFRPTEIQTQPTLVPRGVYAKVTCHF
jgi:iron complex outermembrane receptor protein